jgi:hypothetical protein
LIAKVSCVLSKTLNVLKALCASLPFLASHEIVASLSMFACRIADDVHNAVLNAKAL